MMTVNRPPRPRGFTRARTIEKPRQYYTIQSTSNNAFTMNLKERERTAIVSFRNIDDASLIARMIDSYYIRQKELPDTRDGELILPSPMSEKDLLSVYLQQWDFEDLKVMCTRNLLDIIAVETIMDTKKGYNFSGATYLLEAPLGFYQMRFEELLPDYED